MGSPWFRFYASDWLGSPSVQMMTVTERGIYIQLLAAEWEYGELPSEERLLARLAGATLAQFRLAWPRVRACFDQGQMGYFNPRLEIERARSIDRSEACAQSAAKSVKARDRQRAVADTVATAMVGAKRQRTASRPVPDPVPERSDPPLSPELALTHPPAAPAIGDADFDAVYALYPLHKGKTQGRKVFDRDVRDRQTLGELRAAVDRYAAQLREEGTEPRYVKHFGSFMGCWRDYLEATAVVDDRGPMERAMDEKLAERERQWQGG